MKNYDYDYNDEDIMEQDNPQDFYDNGWEVPPGNDQEREGD